MASSCPTYQRSCCESWAGYQSCYLWIRPHCYHLFYITRYFIIKSTFLFKFVLLLLQISADRPLTCCALDPAESRFFIASDLGNIAQINLYSLVNSFSLCVIFNFRATKRKYWFKHRTKGMKVFPCLMGIRMKSPRYQLMVMALFQHQEILPVNIVSGKSDVVNVYG